MTDQSPHDEQFNIQAIREQTGASPQELPDDATDEQVHALLDRFRARVARQQAGR